MWPPIAGSETTNPRRTDRFAVTVLLIALGGLVLRVVYVLAVQDRRVGGDGNYYHYGANFLVEGQGFLNPVTYLLNGQVVGAARPPAWLVTLAGPSAVGLRTFLQHQLFACVVGALTIVTVGFAGRRIAGPRVGVIACASAAVYPNFWLYERDLLSETLALPVVALTILLAYRYLARPSIGRAVAVAAACGFLALVRAEQLLLLGLLFIPLVMLSRGLSWTRRIQWLAAGSAAAALVVLPWIAYNMSRFEEPVFLATSLGVTLRASNCDATYSGELLGYFDNDCSRDRDLIGDASVRDGGLRSRALDYVRDHAGRVPLVVAAREGRTWGVFRPFQQTSLDTVRGSPLWVLRLGLLVYWVLVPLAVIGAIVLRRRQVPVYPLLAFVAVVAIAVAITIGQTRYRAPAEVSIVLLAAVAVDAVLRKLQRA